jgi:hypothetical protein
MIENMIFFRNNIDFDDKDNEINYFIPKDLDIDNNNNDYFISKNLDIDNNSNNYVISEEKIIQKINIKNLLKINQLLIFSDLCNIDFNDFLSLFNNVMNHHLLFKNKKLDLNLKREYYDTCQFLYFLELMTIIEDTTPELKNTYFFKVIDNVPVIYDSNIFKNNTSKKNKDEPLKGYLLYINLDNYSLFNIMKKYFAKMTELKRILDMIIINDIEIYKLFNIPNLLDILVTILFMKNNFNAIDLIFYDFTSRNSNIDIVKKIDFFKNINSDLLFHSNMYKPQCKLRIIVIYLFISHNMKFH